MGNTLNFDSNEPLHPDLVPFVRNGPLGKMLAHPYVYALIIPNQLCGFYNQQYLAKKEAISVALLKKDWYRYVFMHERAYRFRALEEIFKLNDFDPKTFWSLFGNVWTDSENIHEEYQGWLTLWRHGGQTYRHLIMSAEEQAFLASLSDKVEIYRGYNPAAGTRLGLSWTLDRQKAVWFANRFSRNNSGKVVKKVIKRNDILAYFRGRNEEEIVIDPKNLTI